VKVNRTDGIPVDLGEGLLTRTAVKDRLEWLGVPLAEGSGGATNVSGPPGANRIRGGLRGVERAAKNGGDPTTLEPGDLGNIPLGPIDSVRSFVQTSRAKSRVDAAVAALGRSSEAIRAFGASGEISVEDAARLIRTLAATASAVESVLARSFIGFTDEDARKQFRQALASYARDTGSLCTNLERQLAATLQVAEVASKVYVRTHHEHRRSGNFDDVAHMAAAHQSGSDLETLSYLLDNRETLGRASATILAHALLFASDVPAVAP
jgi:hypothetical protein